MKPGILAVLLLALTACQRDRYEIISIGRGNAYRLDKRTGEVVFITYKDSYRVRTPEETEEKEKEESEARTLEKAADEKANREQGLPPVGGFEEFFTGTDFTTGTDFE